ncbi:UNVERIFIED_CONTAM: AP-2 complex subunit alpha-1 [Sesamum angustifolium]|uniref:AP-2 complex subunit alpha-1 n=1 Tax=Sesamum angustifolium TaxID=2727405 RepID=A0AAW2QP60_9LAMI
MGTDVVKNVNKNNASHAVLFEALALCVALLGKFIAVREPNIRYLGLFLIAKIYASDAGEHDSDVNGHRDVQDIIKRHQAQIITSLKDPDISIRRRALDLLYGMCDVSNAKDIVEELLQFVTNNEDLQSYAALKAREYLDKPAIHETMVKVSAYILGEYSHLLARRPGCSPKEIFHVIHEKLPTVSYESCIDAEIQQRAVEYHALSMKGAALMDILAEMPKFPERQSSLIKKAEESEADTAEQSAIKLRAQQHTSNALVLTDQRPANGTPPVSQLGLVKVPSMTNTDQSTAEQELPHLNGALTVVDPQPPSTPSPDLLGDLLGPLAIEGPSGTAPQSDLGVASGLDGGVAAGALAIAPVEEQTNTVQPIGDIAERFHALCMKDSGVLYEDPYIQIGIKAEWRAHHGRVVLFLGNKNTAPLFSVQALILPPSHLKMELSLVPETIPPRAQVQCPLELVNLKPSRDVAVLDFLYKFGAHVVNVKLRLPAVLNKFLQPITVSPDEFFPQWRSLSGPPLKLQEVVRGVRPMPLAEMANLLNSLHLMVCPGLDPNANNLVASTTFYSESTRAMLCLIRIETDPADRTQLRMTVASGDPTLTFELKEFIKEQLVFIPVPPRAPAPAPAPAPVPPQALTHQSLQQYQILALFLLKAKLYKLKTVAGAAFLPLQFLPERYHRNTTNVSSFNPEAVSLSSPYDNMDNGLWTAQVLANTRLKNKVKRIKIITKHKNTKSESFTKLHRAGEIGCF